MAAADIKKALIATATVLATIYALRQIRFTRDIIDRALIG